MMRYLEVGMVRSVYIPEILVRMRIGGVTNQSWKNVFKQNLEIFAALDKNGIKVSFVLFSLHKLNIRLRQYLAALSWRVS